MKKTIACVITGLLIGTTTTVLASTLLASNITYTPNDKTWQVNNVEDALNDLKNNSLSIDSSNVEVLSKNNRDYTFTDDYRFVFVSYATNYEAGISFKVTGNLKEIKNAAAGVQKVGIHQFIYVGAKKGDNIKISNSYEVDIIIMGVK